MNENRPVIGITCNFIPADPVVTSTAPNMNQLDMLTLSGDYIKSITMAEGSPVILPVSAWVFTFEEYHGSEARQASEISLPDSASFDELTDKYVHMCDGFLISGGDNVEIEKFV